MTDADQRGRKQMRSMRRAYDLSFIGVSLLILVGVRHSQSN
jgi:hypothetical protein